VQAAGLRGGGLRVRSVAPMKYDQLTANDHLNRIVKERKSLESKLKRLSDSERLWAYVAEHGEAPPEIGYDPDEDEHGESD